MIITILALVAVISVLLTGGSPARLAALRLRWMWLPACALALQVLIISVVPGLPRTLLAFLHICSYAVVGVFVIVNRRVPGLWLVGAGGAANLLAIAANGGVMPALPAAVRTAGLAEELGTFANSAVVEKPVLWFLGDVFAIPAGWPLANVFSVGDVLIVTGVFVGLHRICGSRLVRPPAPGLFARRLPAFNTGHGRQPGSRPRARRQL